MAEHETRHPGAETAPECRHPSAVTQVQADRHPGDADDPRLQDLVPRGRRERQLASGWVYIGLCVGFVLAMYLAGRRDERRRAADLRYRVQRLEGGAARFDQVVSWHAWAHEHGYQVPKNSVVAGTQLSTTSAGRHAEPGAKAAGTLVPGDRHSSDG